MSSENTLTHHINEREHQRQQWRNYDRLRRQREDNDCRELLARHCAVYAR